MGDPWGGGTVVLEQFGAEQQLRREMKRLSQDLGTTDIRPTDNGPESNVIKASRPLSVISESVVCKF
jgi:hypothetical protein